MLRDIHTLFLAFALFFAAAEKSNAQDIPVVVHIVSTDPDRITDLMVENGIKDLNDAFSHQGDYAGLGPGYNTGIRFCLAKRDPNGGNTRGITRTKSVLGDFDRDIEDLRMKGLVSWDGNRYCNIWLTDSLKTEMFPTFSCGKWARSTEQGYATFPATGDFLDGVVVTTFGRVLAHNMGHYLGLLHSFTPNSCENGNCNTAGDGICDTPPSSWNVVGCNTVNSCTTDTVNAQGPDLPDLVSNFMTYSDCANSFTKGQADRMKGVLNSNRSSLLWTGRCDPACPAENVLAEFTRDNWFPVPNEVVKFSNTNSRGSTFEWYIDGAKVSDGKSLSHAFPDTGKYGVTLKVYNGDPACFGSQTDSIIVTCGVMSRYYPDKRVIASKDPILLEEVIFTNRSVPLSSSFEWWLGNGGSFPYQKVSTEKDLRYTFLDSGTYTIRLVASLGGCSDTTYPYKIRVEDPTLSIGFGMSPECLDQTKLKLRIQVCNGGYSTMPAGTPITFYDDDPTQVAANKLGQFLIPEKLTGKCCTQFDSILDVGRPFLDKLYGVINDKGNVPPPFKMLEQPPMIPNPNNLLPELLYADNVSKAIGFAFRVSVTPPTAELVPDSLIRLQGRVSQPYNKASWRPSPNLSCQDCLTPDYKAGIADENLRFFASSENGCHDTTDIKIRVPPWNDYVITVKPPECHDTSRQRVEFTVCNDYQKGGVVPAGLQVSFYDGDPRTGTPKRLGSVFDIPVATSGKCGTYTHLIDNTGTGNVFAVVNDKGTAPWAVPASVLYEEKDYTNNIASASPAPFSIDVNPRNASMSPDDVLSMTASVTPNVTVFGWLPSPRLSCLNCLTPTYTAGTSADTLVFHGSIPGGCKDTIRVPIKILPWNDYVITVKPPECHDTSRQRVEFTVCNDYQKGGVVPAGLQVSFYDGDPRTGTPKRLGSVFDIPVATSGKCGTYTHLIDNTGTGNVFAVVNDKGTAPWAVPASVLYEEKDYTNNIASASPAPFSIDVNPRNASMSPGDVLPLAASVTPNVTVFGWLPSPRLSCLNCLTPTYTAGTSADTLVFHGSIPGGCKDTIRVPIKIPPWNDYNVQINDVRCFKNDSLSVGFRLCNLFPRGGVVPAGLKVTFYDGDPRSGTPKRLDPVFILSAPTAAGCGNITHVIQTSTSGSVFAVVNDDGVDPWILPSDKLLEEKDYSNNLFSVPYIPEVLDVDPKSVTVLLNSTVRVKIISAIAPTTNVTWSQGPGYNLLSCTTGCLTNDVVVRSKSVLKIRSEESSGCFRNAEVELNILPPDMRLELISSSCFSNTETFVSFTLHMGNGYDTVFQGIPIVFYDGDPMTGSGIVLQTFITPQKVVGSSRRYDIVVPTPKSGALFMRVNQNSSATIPTPVFPETDLSNNQLQVQTPPFKVTVVPSDTTVVRLTKLTLSARALSGVISKYTWKSASALSCTDCSDPVITAPYSQTITLQAQNQFSCTASDTIILNTYTEKRYNLPTAFTPNRDGLNDVFYMIGSLEIAVIRDFSVYDRYGQRFFHRTGFKPNDPLYGWDGTRNGNPVTMGTYAYTFQVELVDGTVEFLKGLVTVIR